MKTTLHYLTEQTNTNLFRTLFELRLALEDQNDERLNNYQDEVAHIIQHIDHLLQMVMEDSSN